ncbi:uncharacterized protein LOC105702062 [Orussus abietinus]|uniref:uncharacterized protein LOC105702062 n=1 Tax=Orussus abietinus TaxID=222816 RepID=UPI0006269A9D|nr:uncharacterized protein LOC105702062 [Orussus abietinus]
MKIFLIIGFLIAAAAAEFSISDRPPTSVRVNLNNFLDRAIPHVAKFMIDHQLDPMKVPDIIDLVKIRRGPITYKGYLHLSSGLMRNLTNFVRHNDVTATYRNKVLKVDIGTNHEALDVYFKYVLSILGIPYSGTATAVGKSLVLRVKVRFDILNYRLTLESLKAESIGPVRVSLKDNVLVDWLVTPIVNIFLPLFKRTIIVNVEKQGTAAIESTFREINAILARRPR